MTVHSGPRKGRGEAGETLAELLVTISIIGLAVVVLVGALATAIKASTTHREHSTADTMARSIAEAFKNPDPTVPPNPNPGLLPNVDVYVDCATSYPTTTVDTTRFTVTQKITYWKGNGSAHEGSDFVSSCNSPADDKGLQLVRITVTANGPKAESDTVSILKRRVTAAP
jgi:hypothetical protein